jgi:hypothetical protein
MILVCEIERELDMNVRVRFCAELGEWIREQDFLKWNLQKRLAFRYLPYLGYSDQFTSGGIFTGGENVEYRWKSHRRRLQVAPPGIMMLKNMTLT